MAFTLAQLQAIKADINGTPALAAFPNTDAGNTAIADLYNLTASPAFIVWRTAVMVRELNTALVWVDVDNLSVGKARIWDWMGKQNVIDPSSANVRAGFAACFGANSGSNTGILAICKRSATRIEKVLASGTGSDAVPATMGFEGLIDSNDIGTARNS